MAPLTFEKPLCGLSLDMFNKDFVHEHVWELEHGDATKKVNFVNNMKLTKDGRLFGFTNLKGECSWVRGEVKLQSAGTSHVDVATTAPLYKPLTLHSKFAFDTAKKNNVLTLAAEHALPFNTTQFKFFPYEDKFSAFSMLHLKGNTWTLTAGGEVTGLKKDPYGSHVVGAAYKNACCSRTYQLAARVFGDKEVPVKTVVGNVYASAARGFGQNAFAATVEHKLEDASNKLKFAGLWYMAGGTANAHCYLKGKCDSDGQVAVTVFQRFNERLAAAVGIDFNAKTQPALTNVNYGFKFLLS
ncbi:hypothetical protein BgAZ_107760 [Babesia gibsoni]|uniref:Uncharacterized protein n=1 Tax=Babesia gibsoni TaxID=33632 RepID=A0AAD8PG63_BABGI|nr:hypothetical protein BgAZ_107760 [Babesia gibsoni]